MQFHNLKKNKANKKSQRVGRGGKRGKTSGRGTKGQNARAGRKKRPEMRDIIKKIPKLRGRGRNFLKSRFEGNFVVKMDKIAKTFANGSIVSPQTLVETGLVNTKSGKIPYIKVLGTIPGKSFVFKNVKLSLTAKKNEQSGA